MSLPLGPVFSVLPFASIKSFDADTEKKLFGMISAAADAHIAQSNAPINVARLTALSPLAQWVYELGWACAHNNSFWGPSAALLSRLFQERSIPDQIDLVMDPLSFIWEELAAQDATRTKDARANLVALAKELRRRDLLPVERARSRFAGEFLVAMGDVRDLTEGYRKLVNRIVTAHRLSQAKHNLFREESEGFSKLITLLHSMFTSLSVWPPADVTQINAAPDAAGVTMVDRIRSLIGHFRLDPNRTVDLVLDAYLNDPLHPTFLPVIDLFNPSHVTETVVFRFSQLNDATASSDPVWSDPAVRQAFHRVVAVLLRAGRVPMQTLLAHLDRPADEQLEMIARRRQVSADAAACLAAINVVSIGGDAQTGTEFEKRLPDAAALQWHVNDSATALQAASDLQSTTVNSNATATSAATLLVIPSAATSRLDLCAALIELGDWEVALPLLQRLKLFEPVAYAPVAQALLSRISVELDAVYGCVAQKYQFLSSLDAVRPPLRSPVAPLAAPASPSSHSHADAEPEAGEMMDDPMNIDDAEPAKSSDAESLSSAESLIAGLSRMQPLLAWLGGAPLSTSPLILTKLLRVLARCIGLLLPARFSVQTLTSPVPSALPSALVEKGVSLVEIVLRDCVLGAFSSLSANVSLSHELWSVLRLLPYPRRFALYAYWKESCYAAAPELTYAKIEALRQAKYFQKRLAKENVKTMRRQLLEFALPHPVIVFDSCCSQLERFDNMIPVYADVFRYLTPLSFDVLSFVLLQRLTADGRPRIQEDGINLAKWYQNLAQLAGAVFCKYADAGSIAPLLQYVVAQLKDSRHDALLVLNELIKQVTAIEATEDLSEAQLLGQSGGNLLRSETAAFSQGGRKIRRATPMLLQAMKRDALFIPLFVLIAQQRSVIMFKHNAAETDNMSVEEQQQQVGLLADAFDRCQDSLMQFAEFMQLHVPNVKEYAAMLPPLSQLVQQFNLTPESAFMLIRPVASIESIYGDACSLVAAVQSIASDATWKYLTPELYATFWQLGMSDLHVPRQAYAEAQKKLQEQLTAPQTEKTEDRGDKKSDQKEKIQASITALQKELARQEELGNQCSERLKSEHSTWFKIGAAVLAVHAAPPPPANATFPLPNSMRSRLISSTTAFFQFCLLPRLLSSPLDSMYCATFVERLIELNTPGFSFIELLDVVSRSVRPLIACSTTNEMSRFARFLHLLFRQVAHWLYRIQFEKQTPKLCAFFQHDRGSPYTFTMFANAVASVLLKITKTVESALQSESRVEQRNALTLLSKLAAPSMQAVAEGSPVAVPVGAAVFPRLSTLGSRLEQHVRDFSDKLDRSDALKALSVSVLTVLATQKKNWLTDVLLFQGVKVAVVTAAPAPVVVPTTAASPSQNDTVENSTDDKKKDLSKADRDFEKPRDKDRKESKRDKDEKTEKTDKAEKSEKAESKESAEKDSGRKESSKKEADKTVKKEKETEKSDAGKKEVEKKSTETKHDRRSSSDAKSTDSKDSKDSKDSREPKDSRESKEAAVSHKRKAPEEDEERKPSRSSNRDSVAASAAPAPSPPAAAAVAAPTPTSSEDGENKRRRVVSSSTLASSNPPPAPPARDSKSSDRSDRRDHRGGR